MTFQQGFPPCIGTIIEGYVPGSLFWVQFLDGGCVFDDQAAKMLNFLEAYIGCKEGIQLTSMAAAEGKPEIVKLLIGKGTTDPRDDDFRILREAIKGKQFLAAEWIIRYFVGPDDDILNRVVLRIIELDEVETFKWIFNLESNKGVTHKFQNDVHAMTLILEHGSLDIVKHMFSECLDIVEHRNTWVDIALDTTMTSNHAECVHWLVNTFGGYQMVTKSVRLSRNRKLQNYLQLNAPGDVRLDYADPQ